MCNERREPIHYVAGGIRCISSSCLTADVNAKKRGDGRSKETSKRARCRVADRTENQSIWPRETERLEGQSQERHDKQSVMLDATGTGCISKVIYVVHIKANVVAIYQRSQDLASISHSTDSHASWSTTVSLEHGNTEILGE